MAPFELKEVCISTGEWSSRHSSRERSSCGGPGRRSTWASSARSTATNRRPTRSACSFSLTNWTSIAWAIWTYKDIGLQGLVRVNPGSPYMQRIGDVVAKKARLGAVPAGGVCRMDQAARPARPSASACSPRADYSGNCKQFKPAPVIFPDRTAGIHPDFDHLAGLMQVGNPHLQPALPVI